MISVRKSVHCPWVAAILLVGVAGCGDGNAVVPVTGTLTYKGKPVTNAFIDLTPESGRPSWGQTDGQGHFKLEYDRQNEGALLGKHKVSVRMRSETAAEREAAMKGQQPAMSKDMAEFFEKYSLAKSKKEVVIDKATKELKLDWD